MSTRKKPKKRYPKPFARIWRILQTAITTITNQILPRAKKFSHRRNRSQAGFVLPTAAMVIVVVVLLSTALLFRSFDRGKNINNYRVNQEVLNAALPGLDRAKAKIQALFEDPNLPQGTPTEIALSNVIEANKYTLEDEDRLQVSFDWNETNGIQTSNNISETETINSAWRFPVDTNNNGLYDSVTLYGVFYRTPLSSNQESERPRNPLDARGLPMETGILNDNCTGAIGSATLVGNNGWYQVAGQLKKSFFVYVATVPIVDANNFQPIGQTQAQNYEQYQGNKGFSALEYQLDKARIPLANNSVIYEDDLEISSGGGGLTVNGRVLTNSNLFYSDGGNSANPVTFRQVSSPESCFFQEENGKIIVGGNLSYGKPTERVSKVRAAKVDLFQGINENPTEVALEDDQDSVDANSDDLAYNNEAYEARIEKLVELAMDQAGNLNAPNLPLEVRQRIQDRQNGPNPPNNLSQAYREELDAYFRKRTRRVPFAEVSYNPNNSPEENDPELENASLQIDNNDPDTMRPPNAWIFPYDPGNGTQQNNYSQLALNKNGNKLLPPATKFSVQERTAIEEFLGDRILVGNNLPALWYKDDEFVGEDEEQDISNTQWNKPDDGPRTRKTRVTEISDLGGIDRDRFWETKAAQLPENKLDPVGGVRIVTGAGIYLPADDTTNGSQIVWPDWMPVIPNDETDPNAITWLPDLDGDGDNDFPQDSNGAPLPFLQMRASVVYHYSYDDDNDPQTPAPPIACVSSFYDPTNAETAQNTTDGGNSNNGITYAPPSSAGQGQMLDYQASLVYPNGRLVNPMLAAALQAIDDGETPTLAQQAAIDSSLCALQILAGTINESETPTSGFQLPDDTIKEIAFLDSRQIKSVEDEYDPANSALGNDLDPNYDLAIEQREPMEIRATVIDLDLLRESTAQSYFTGVDEYMLPNSGIIYASRDDALPDASDSINPLVAHLSPQEDDDGSNPALAATDFKLDPTRRPNAIMLINGDKLSRTDEFREEEKGLTLVSNLPVYIQGVDPNESNTRGGFNPHQDDTGNPQEEFTESYDPQNYNQFYDRSNLNENFACRANDPRLPSGSCTDPDQWRAANILSDAVTLLSAEFREGFRNEGDYDLRNNQIDSYVLDLDGNPDLGIAHVDLDGDNNPDSISARDPDGGNLTNGNSIEERRLFNGFWNNNFVTNGLSSGVAITDTDDDDEIDTSDDEYLDSDYTAYNANTLNSSYFNNLVTPVQRRANFPEYLMEFCQKLPVSECTPQDWVINTTGTRASDAVGSAPGEAGTTAQTPDNLNLQRLARRVAFLRMTAGISNLQVNGSPPSPMPANDELILDNNENPIPLGINNSGDIICQTYSGTVSFTDLNGNNRTCNTTAPRNAANALWFRTVDGTDPYTNNEDNWVYRSDRPLYLADEEILNTKVTGLGQPLLVPVLQLQFATATPGNNLITTDPKTATSYIFQTNWLPRAAGDGSTPGIFNLVMGTGDTPNHPDISNVGGDQNDFNGGLANLPRFLESWRVDIGDNYIPVQIRGSLLQLRRSRYATAPFRPLIEPTWDDTFNRVKNGNGGNGGLFGYVQGYAYNNQYLFDQTRLPYYVAPKRDFGFDVGVLSQLPDLFSLQFTVPEADEPNEFFREVSRDDEWVQALLCAKVDRDGNNPPNAINDEERPTTFCQNHTGG
ncbi:hormogonium polysaccharide biosynthesis protein HpsA [Oscillatoria salina]|uniref:hormogonium polysaccharide biosynthesis protein HpsA n=1 Tax=Oscillatoria salina TaxID=331517 RepID=UPI0013B67CD1|nr:hormogonium polysaccharide biosynthesis protein HpsA [Oscillatoria salina]MBZ8182211.1 hypothetical protein [Oscillatoria salina IIICB1]NET89075.1 hypothetical protein [Kamptonema sp. SIO1D9]